MERDQFLNEAALAVSRFLHPFIISVPLGILFLYLSGIGPVEATKWISIAALITLLPIFAFLRARSDYSIRAVNSREKRNLLYLIGLIQITGVAVVFRILSAPETVQLSSVTLLILALVGGLINRFTKISLHVGILSGFSTAISFMSIEIGSLWFLLTLVVGWARIRLERHTLQQVALGLSVPALFIAFIFSMFL